MATKVNIEIGMSRAGELLPIYCADSLELTLFLFLFTYKETNKQKTNKNDSIVELTSYFTSNMNYVINSSNNFML